jgi:transposase
MPSISSCSLERNRTSQYDTPQIVSQFTASFTYQALNEQNYARAFSIQVQRLFGACSGCAFAVGLLVCALHGKERWMPAPLGQDLRDRVLAAYDRGSQTGEIAKTFQVSPAWARRIKQVRREEGRTKPLPMGGVRVVKVDLQKLVELVEEQPDATTAELHQRLGNDTCSPSAVTMALQRLDLSFKKRRCMPASKTAPTSPKDARSGLRRNRRKTHRS